MEDPKAAELLDELMVLSGMYMEDYNIVRKSLDYIAKCRKINPQFPITVSLANYMRKDGMIE